MFSLTITEGKPGRTENPCELRTSTKTYQIHFKNGKEIIKTQNLHFEQVSLKVQRHKPTKAHRKKQANACNEIIVFSKGKHS
jgi:hypothetical protein